MFVWEGRGLSRSDARLTAKQVVHGLRQRINVIRTGTFASADCGRARPLATVDPSGIAIPAASPCLREMLEDCSGTKWHDTCTEGLRRWQRRPIPPCCENKDVL